MPIYRLQGPDGRIYRLEGPENAPDAELIAALEGHLAEEARIAAIKEETTALGRGFSRGIDVAGQGFGSALEGLGRTLGIEGLEEYGAEMVAENEAQLAEQEAIATRLGDVEGVGTGLDFFLETLGETAPLTGTSLAAGAIAGGKAGAVFGPVGSVVGGLAGAAVSQLPFFYGFNRERQKEAIDRGLQTEISESAAALTAIPQASLDAIAERFMVGKFLTPKAIQAGGLFTRAGKGTTAGVISEVPTEIGQTILERAQAGLPLADEEAIDEYTEVGIAAGIVGGTLGGGVAGLRGRVDEEEGGPDTTGEEVAREPITDGEQADLFAGVEGADRAEFEGPSAVLEAEIAALEAEAAAETEAELEARQRDMFEEDEARRRMPVVYDSEAALAEAIAGGETLEVTSEGEIALPDQIDRSRVVAAEEADNEAAAARVRQKQADEAAELERIRGAKGRRELTQFQQEQDDLFPSELTIAEREALTAKDLQDIPESARPAVTEDIAPDKPKQVTKKFLNDLGVAPKANLRKRIEKKKLTDPQIREVLTNHANLKSTPNVVKTNINRFLDTTPEEGRYTQVSETGQLAFNFRAKPTPRPEAPIQGEPDVSVDRGIEQEPSGVGVSDTGRVAEGEPQPVSDTIAPSGAEGVTTPELRRLGDTRQRAGTTTAGATRLRSALDNLKSARLARRGDSTRFIPTTVTDDGVVQDDAILETTLMEESDARRDAARAAAEDREAALRDKDVTPGERARVLRGPKGAEPALTDVDPELRKQAETATEKEIELRDQSEENRKAEIARKQREANRRRTEAAKDTETETPAPTDVAKKRRKPKSTKLKSLPEDVVKEANKRIDQGEPGSVNEIISQIKEELGLPRFQEGVDTPLPAPVLKELRQGNLKEALELLSETDANPTVKRLAKQFSTMVGTTKVAVVPAKPEALTGKDNYYALKDKKTAIAYRQYLDAKGRRYNTVVPGIYVTKSDARDRKHFNDLILLNEETSEGLAVSTLMHEMAHAVTANVLLNPSHPVTKQLTKLFELVKPELSSVNGTDNVAEFAAEAYGSEDFRQQLARIQIQVKDNQYVKRGGEFISALQAFYNTISNFLKKLIGRAPVELSNTDTFTEVDALLQRIIAPAADTYGSGDLLQNSTDVEVRDLMRKMGNVQKDFKEPTKKFREDFANQADKFLKSGVSGVTRRAFLGFLPSQALSDVAGSFNKRLGELGLQLHRMMENQRGDLNTRDNAADGTMKMVDNWVKDNQDVVPLLDEVITESTLEGVDPSKPRSTYENDKARLAVWKGLQPKWNKLAASGGQDVYKGMRDSYAKLYKDLLDVVNKRIDDLSIDKESKEKLRKSVFDKITERGRIDPYFPLMRSGDYKLSFQAYNEATDSTEPVFLMFETPRERRKYIEKVLENDNRVERDSDGALVYNEYDGNDSPTYKKTTSVGFVNEVLEIMETAKVDAAVRNEILNSFIETLPETSFAKNFQKREGIAGFNQNHTQVMRSKIYDIGRQITRLEYTNKITKLQQQIRGTDPDMSDSEASKMQRMGEKEGVLKDLQDELVARADFAMRPPKDGIAQAANRAAFIWTIGFNASSALVNLSQVPLFVLPMLGGKHGFRAAGKAITDAAGLVSGTLTSKSTRQRRIKGIVPFGKQDKVDVFAMPSIDNLFEMDEAGNYVVRKDIEGYTERRKELEEILPLVQLAAQRNQLNRSLFAETLGLDSSGRDKTIMDRISSWSAFMFHQVEQYNRQVSMLAAYRLELDRLNDPKRSTAKEKGLSTAKKRELAAQNALYEAQQLNGGSVLETAPRFAQQGIGRVALMYKTYGIQMYYTMLRAAKTMLNRENDPEIRKAAFRQLVAVQGTALFFAGVQGLPLFGAFTMIANLFLDEDEDDAETIVRKHIGEGWYKGGLTALLDVDVSQRVALTNLLFQVNRYNRDASPEETIGYYLGGPAWSVGKSFIRGTGELINGDMQRGIESMVPGAVRNGLKAIRYTEEGALTRRKDPILDDITTGQLFSQVVGFAPADYARRQEENQGLKRIENTVRNNRSALLKKYYLAVRMQDYEEAREVKKEIIAFNKRVGRRFPRAVITADSVERSMKSHMRTSATMHNGIALSPMFRTALQQHLEDSEPITLKD